MKKIILQILALLLLIGCSKTEKNIYIESIIEQTNNHYISINYPITNINKIDKQIKKEINKEITNFKNQNKKITLKEKPELNIDYTLSNINNSYLSITLHITNNKKYNTFIVNYDIQNKKIITLNNLTTKNQIKKILPSIKINLLNNYKNCILTNTLDKNLTEEFILKTPFAIKEDYLTLYIDNNKLTNKMCKNIEINIPLQNLNININKTKKEKEVIKINPINKVLDPNLKTVALSFDDGPSKYTKEIIDTLKENNMNATFFILGNKVENYKDLLLESINNGNELGNHSYNHKCLTKLNKEEQQEQLTKTNNIVKELLNYEIKRFRPTYGAYNQSLKENTNLEMTLWTVDTKDWKYKDSNTIIKKTLPNIKDGSIILMHDTKKVTVKTLKQLLQELKKQGYQVVTISDLKEIEKLRNEQQQ